MRYLARPRATRRTFIGGALALAAIAVLAGCTASDPVAVTAASQPTTASTADPPSSSTTTTTTKPHLTTIGTVTKSDAAGTSLTVTYALGSLLTDQATGNPPPGVLTALQACNHDTTTVIDRSVYVPGQLTITYKGDLPGTMAINPEADTLGYPTPGTDPLTSGGPAPVEQVDVDGSWICAGITTTRDNVLSMQNGQSVVLTVWLVADVLTDTRPTVTTTDFPQWAFAGTVARIVNTTLPTVTFSVPHATVCTNSVPYQSSITQPDRIGMFKAPLYSLSYTTVGGPQTYQCSPA